MSLMEVLVALAVVLILISTLIGVGGYVKTRAQIDHAKGMLETLCTALARYYDDQVPKAFPFDTDTNGNGVLDAADNYLQMHLEVDLSGTVTPAPPPVLLEETDGIGMTVSTASSAALFYFLDKYPSSRAIVENIANTLITNKDDNGTDIQINIGGMIYDLPRYIDPWGTSIRYVYLDGTAFPTLTSAGPDKVFDTPDDITSK
jgi:type II secretory pathway pseudopilin PulG